MVKITYKGETRDVPATYLKGLKGKEREQQIKSIFQGKMRPKTKHLLKEAHGLLSMKRNIIRRLQIEHFCIRI